MGRYEPVGFQEDGTPIWARNDKGEPICGAQVRCQCTDLDENGVCEVHRDKKAPLRYNGLVFRNKQGQQICAVKDANSGRCQQGTQFLMGNGRCGARGHGGKGAKKGTQHRKERQLIRTREQFLKALATIGDADAVAKLLYKLQEIALENGNLDALKYILNQLFGGPTTTIEHRITGQIAFDMAIQVTARHLRGEAFTKWYEDYEIAMAGAAENEAAYRN